MESFQLIDSAFLRSFTMTLCSRILTRLCYFYLLALTFTVAAAADGLSLRVDDKHYAVSTGAGLEFHVLRDSGGIPSLKFKGTELNGPRVSGIASGLGSVGTSTRLVADEEKIIITVQTDQRNEVAAELTHYYVVRRGENTIYMATHAEREPGVGELRWITRMKSSLFPAAPAGSDLRGTTGSIESQDIFGMADRTSRSKYYGNERAMDLTLRGVMGKGVGVFMAYGNRESSAGGPFFRDIQNQTGENAAEVYNYMNSGHAQTEELRLGVLYGPYALMITDGGAPEKEPDMGFMAELGLKEYTTKSRRGTVKLEGLLGRDPRCVYVVGFSNTTAQYWATVGEETVCSGMKPGDYVMKVYKGELSVHSAPVTVKPGKTTSLPSISLTQDPAQRKALWRIGEWDGTPLEFRNGRSLSLMHPSDARMATWKCGDFIMGSSALTDFPACQWRGVNNGQVVSFNLTKEEISDCDLRIGITTGVAGGRPRVMVNEWESRLLQGARQMDSRSLTIGTYRGNNATYTFKVPAKALKEGENRLHIHVVSGQSGGDFLGPGYAFDCVDLCPRE